MKILKDHFQHSHHFNQKVLVSKKYSLTNSLTNFVYLFSRMISTIFSFFSPISHLSYMMMSSFHRHEILFVPEINFVVLSFIFSLFIS
jgi:hypothetical protein